MSGKRYFWVVLDIVHRNKRSIVPPNVGKLCFRAAGESIILI